MKVLKNKAVVLLLLAGFSCALSFGVIYGGQLIYPYPDDFLLNLCASGAYGKEHSQYLVFINILLGYVVKFFYLLFPGLNVYAIFTIGLQAAAFWALYASIYEIKQGLRTSGVKILLFGIVQIFLSLNFTYTILAAVLTVLGLVLLYHSTYLTGKKYQAAGAALVCCGFLLRTPSFLVALLLGAPLLVLIWRRRSRKSNLFTAGFILAFCAAAALFNAWSYQSDAQWKAQMQRLDYRVVDYRPVDYQQNQAAVEAIGLTENDLDCYYNWIFSDFETFSIERLKALSQIYPLPVKYNLSLPQLFAQMAAFSYNYFFALAIFLMLAAQPGCWKGFHKKQTYPNGRSSCLPFGRQPGCMAEKTNSAALRLFLCAAAVVLPYGAILGLFIRRRWPGNAVFMIYLASLIVILACLPMEGRAAKPKRIFSAVQIFSLCILLTAAGVGIKQKVELSRHLVSDAAAKTAEVLEWQQQNPEKLVVGTIGPINTFYNVPIFDTVEDAYLLNRVKLGSWDMGSRRWYDQLARFDVDPEKLLQELAVKENLVLLVDGDHNLQLIQTYLQEHGAHAQAVLLEVFPQSGWKMVRFSAA